MHPILARYGPFFLYSYTVIMALGLAAGIGLAAWLARRREQPISGWFDALLAVLIAGLVGGRAGFVIANLTYFADRPGEIALVWQGGLSYHGALLGGLMGLLVWSAWKRRSFFQFAGLLAASMVLVSAFGWFACYMEGCAYGREATFGFLVSDLPDSYGVFALRYQTQLTGVALCLVILAVVLFADHRVRAGTLFGLSLILLSVVRVLVSLYRGDMVPQLGALRWDTLLDSTIAIVTAFVLLLSTIVRGIRSRSPA
ncbi:MAG: prolipoprotein diacylglyceryl transferase [Chloroflexota bacterium]|jgi:phosphatidylglycerol:prolipoprotein diacylglycerol transferase